MKWYLKCLRQYADFSGRARRKEYWMFTLFNIFIILFCMCLLSVVSAVIATISEFSEVVIIYCLGASRVVLMIYNLAVLLPTIAVIVRRLHDTGRSGCWLLLYLVPVVGWIVLFIFMLLKGDSGENEYGYDPLDETGAGADATSEEKYQLDDSCALIHEVSPEKLINAANDGNVALVNELLEKDADVNAANKDGMTALMFASGRGHTETAKLLIEKGADVNAADKNGMTALMVASVNGRTEMAKLLIEKGADVNVTGKDGRTTLMLASGNGHTETAKFLIEKGVDVNSVINNGLTALMLASSFGHTETVKLLREKGADVNTVNKYGHTALMLASENGHTETAKLLREKGAKPEAGNAVSNHAKYQSYTGSGVCDVCNRSLSGVKAYVVPNNVFYNSPKWRAHFKKVSLVGATDADIERMRSIDKSQGSAICENCIHMF